MISFYDGKHGEGLAIPLFLFQTCPSAFLLVIAVQAYRADRVPLRTLVMVVAFLFLLPLQFLQDWLILLLLFGSFPVVLVWMYVIVRSKPVH